jgi:antitoxin (DNA-binding transcriptional repressor) of toxin-antitoxin stability system
VLARVERGERVIVTRDGRAIAELRPPVGPEERTRATPDQIANSGIYDQPKPAGYERELLAIVERGREQGRLVGDQ